MEREPVNESFVFHYSFIKGLPQEYKMKFAEWALDYGFFGKEPDLGDNPLEAPFWNIIRERIDSDKNTYKETCEKRAEAGRIAGIKSGEKRRQNSKNEPAEPNVQKMNERSKNERFEHEYDSEYESDTEFDSDSHTDSEFVSPCDENSVCESQETGIDKAIRDKESVFLELWDASPQIFGIRTTGILRPKQYHEYFKSDFVTESYIRQGMRNFVNAVKDGSLEACYIPKTFENFILNNTLARYQEPRGKKPNAEAVRTAEKYMPKKQEFDVSAIPENWAEAD